MFSHKGATFPDIPLYREASFAKLVEKETAKKLQSLPSQPEVQPLPKPVEEELKTLTIEDYGKVALLITLLLLVFWNIFALWCDWQSYQSVLLRKVIPLNMTNE